MSQMLLLKIYGGIWENQSRDVRELSVVKELGVDAEVIAKGECTGEIEIISGYKVHKISTRPLGRHVPNSVNRIISLFTWSHFVRKFDADIISGHDILGLSIGYLSNLWKKKKAKLVYDSHEFEIGRAAERSRLSIVLIKWLECFLIKRSDFSIMVNDSIADEVQRIHNQAKRAIVVRNTPMYWKLDREEIEKTRNRIIREMEIDSDPFIVIYHGGVFRERGVEVMLQAISMLENVCGIILGNCDEDYEQELKERCSELGVRERIYFHAAVSHSELYKYTGAADVGIITIPGLYKSYYYMLPNKFFENVQSLTPVIVSDFPEIAKLTTKYGIGIKVDPSDVNQIAAAIKKMQDDKSFYQKCKENIKIAKNDLCWENEKKSLEEAYKTIIFE